MSSTINLGNIQGNKIVGLGSGLDSQKIIDSLATVRKQPIDALNTKITANNTKVTKFGDLTKLLNTLQTSLNYLRNPSGVANQNANVFESRIATLSSSTLTSSSYLSVLADPGAQVGSSKIQIGQLATTLQQQSGSFNSRNVSATTAATGSYFTAGTFQIGSGIVTAQAGTTKTGFTLSSGSYEVKGAGTGILTADGIKNITVTGGSGGQVGLEGAVSGFTGSIGTTAAIFNVKINGVTYTSNAVDITQTVNTSHTGIASGTTITFTADSGGVNQTSFDVTTASDATIDDAAAGVTAFASSLNNSVSSQTILQARKISNFTDANVKSPLTGLTNNNIILSSSGYNSAGAFGDISGFTVKKSTGSDGVISVDINGETFRATGLGTTVNSNLVLKSTSTDRELRINLADAGVSTTISTDTNASNLERAFDYAFGARALTNITVNSGETLNDVIFSVNNKANITGASASIISVSNSDFRFNLKAANEGLDNKYDIFDASGVLTHAGLSTTQAAQDAKVTIDGIEITRSSNSISDAISNVTLNLLGVTPNYGSNTDIVNINIDNDVDTVTTGIKNFLDSYNAVRVFYSTQNQRDPNTGLYAKDSVLGGDTTLQALVNQLSSEITAIVSNTSSSNFNSLSDVGISLQDFAGDSTTAATSNILTFDQSKLQNALAQNFDRVREIFEFKFNTSSTNLSIFKTSNNYSLNNFKLDFDINQPAGEQVKLQNADGTDYLDTNGDKVYLDAVGGNITGKTGTPLEGFQFIYNGDGTDNIAVSFSQGIGDNLYNILDANTKTDGLVDKATQNIGDSNTTYQTQIKQLQDRLDTYTKSLQNKFSALESAIASVNNILNLLDANTAVRNSNN